MIRSKIEWTDFSCNPVKGLCPVGCEYCYARAMYHRFKWDPTIQYDGNVILEAAHILKPSRIFVGSTMELFGDWVEEGWLQEIKDRIAMMPWHTFIFLTKKPENLSRWNPWPDNAWVGTTATDGPTFENAVEELRSVKAATRFISIEPMLDRIDPDYFVDYEHIDWLIVGAETGNRKEKPPLTKVQDWVGTIVSVADHDGIPLFIKGNLNWPTQRQEFPL